MSTDNPPSYRVSLKHLTRDGKRAAADLPALQLDDIPPKQLRGIIEAMAALGPEIVYPIEPELRVTTLSDKFVVQLKGGKLQLVSWSSSHKGGEYPASRVYSIITGEEVIETVRGQTGAGAAGWRHGKATIVLLILAIVAVNSFTIWFVARPKKTLLPKYTLLAPEPAERLLANVAGAYETGGASGDRRLEIDKAGHVERYKLGPERVLKDKQTFTVTAAEAAGKPALLTSRRSLITVNDPLTVVLYGDKYRRVAR